MCEMEGCISYIQLYNKHCQNLVAYNSIHLFSHSFCGLGIREQLGYVVLVQGLSFGYSQDVSWGCSHQKA